MWTDENEYPAKPAVSVRKGNRPSFSRVQDVECRLVLEKRYLTFCRWEEIAADMYYSIRTVQRIHTRALEAAEKVMGRGE